MKKLHTVYDISESSPLSLFSLLPLIFVLIGLGIFFYHKKYGDERIGKWGMQVRQYKMTFAIIFTSIAALILLAFISSPLKNYFIGKRIYKSGNVKTVEGTIENFHPMPPEGHAHESFDVNTIHFEYGNYDLSDFGYNNAASHGGAAAEGLFVRITYSPGPYRNEILKFETE